ncbi:MAG: leucyl-tRNA synthetase, leucyl-tRNA synthetase, partial [Candidatus Peregrinibacteria bacterium GW2011_GWE2_39_6]
IFDISYITHSYPHCWRDETPLLNYATTSWFVKVTDIKDDLVAANNKVKWVPDHVGANRFGKWLEGARDWAISRQRYWGAPIPIINCEKCGEMPVPEKDLPVVLPRIKNYKPKGKAPLATSTAFMNTRCPKCGGKATREPDTMDTFVCSSWYFLRYPSSTLKNKPFDPEILKTWSPVDMYIGGPEHACMHLLYARFVNRMLFDAGLIPSKEPFKRLVHQGMITKDGAKMSKSRGNVVSPDAFVQKYGSDVFRMYLMFMGPFTQGGDWNDKGIIGIVRFVQKIWKVLSGPSLAKISPESQRATHRTIKKVTENIENLHFNTALAALMELINEVTKEGLDQKHKKIVTQLIAPMAPHLSEELWALLNDTLDIKRGSESIFDQKWPKYDEKLIAESTINLVIQINGKLRGMVETTKLISKDDAFALAKMQPNVQRYLADQKIVKEIFVPGKLVNFVVR